MMHSILWKLASVTASAVLGVTGTVGVSVANNLSQSPVALEPDAPWQMKDGPIDVQSYSLVAATVSPRSERVATTVAPSTRDARDRLLALVGVMPSEIKRTTPPKQKKPVHLDAAALLERDLAALPSPTAAQALASAPQPKHTTVSYRYDRHTTPGVVARRLAVAHQRAAVCMTNAYSEMGKQDREADVFFVIDRKGGISEMRTHGYGTGGSAVMPCVEKSYVGMKFAPPESRFIEVTDIMKLRV